MKKALFFVACMTVACFGLQAEEKGNEELFLFNESEVITPQSEQEKPFDEKLFDEEEKDECSSLLAKCKNCPNCDKNKNKQVA